MQKMNPYVYLLSLGHFGADWAQAAIPALLPYFITTCHLSYQDAGSLIFANVLLSSITQPFFGYYSDKISKPWFVPMGPLLCGICISAFAFTTNYWVIFFFSMLSGLGSSIFHPEAALLVNKISGKLKGQALGSFSVGGNTGFAIGPMLAAFCAYKFNIKGLVIIGIVNVILALCLYAKMSKILSQADGSPSVDATNATSDAEATLDAPTTETAVTTSEAPVTYKPEPTNDWPAFRKLTALIFTRSAAFTISNTFIPIYWINVLGTSPATGSLALSFLFSLGVLMTYLGGILADRAGYIKVLKFSMICMVPTMLIFFNSTNIWLSTALLIPLAFALFACYSPIVILGQTYLGKNIGLASGITMGLGSTVGGMMSPLVGWLADNYGVSQALQILWLIAIVGAVYTFRLPKPKA